ncbi:MAG: TRAP transporter fused permease subunit [Armatimonadetes bacterium]|nr:TRAP transporter fused permease subunit [Armatimonadota bacterium]MDW8154413.1 TRAP transporter fused permease subunit [Armatimonadota bacterium]
MTGMQAPEAPRLEVEELLERFEGATRKLGGPTGWLVTLLALVGSLYHLWAAQAPYIRQLHLTRHLLLVLVLTFLLYPGWKGARRGVHPVDWLLVILSILGLGWVFWDFERFVYRQVVPNVYDLLFGTLTLLAVLEATRRTTGWPLVVLAVAFLLYAFYGSLLPEPWTHRGYDLHRVIGHLYVGLEGIFGVPLDVSASFIILFTLYGSFLEQSGAGKYFVDLAFALMGRRRAGAGQAVTVASFLLGGPSGSGVATTVTVGAIAYPLLRRSGYDPESAGGLLSAGGIGAVISPPILGAAAFLIAEILKISYLQVMVLAIVPTLLYYFSILLMIELDVRRFGLRQVEIPSENPWRLAGRYWYLLASLILIPLFMVRGFTAIAAVFWCIVTTALTSLLRPETALVAVRRAPGARAWPVGIRRLVGGTLGAALALLLTPAIRNLLALPSFLPAAALCAALGAALGAAAERAWREPYTGPPLRLQEPGFRGLGAWEVGGAPLVAALVNGTKQVLTVAVTCAVAGIIVGVITLTGLGLKLSGIIVDLAQGQLLLTLLYAGIALWILGLALPITATYIIAAAIIAPALIRLGVHELAAHMFIFYYAILSEVSPPVGLSPLAASALTGGNAFRTMLMAWKYTLPAFVVPLMFTVHPEGMGLLLHAPWEVAAKVILTSLLGLVSLSAAVNGWLLRRTTWPERVVLTLCGLLLIYPATALDLVAAGGFGAVTLLQWFTRPQPAPERGVSHP